jgi:Ran-binding protein 9/10
VPLIYILCITLTSIQQERRTVRKEIENAPTTSLRPPLDETALIQRLVAQYLAHDGYVETARAFGEEIQFESFGLNDATTPKGLESQDDFDAINRQRKRNSV